MNKRARLTRRILREHRRGTDWHCSRDFTHRDLEVWRYWSCTHCSGIGQAGFERNEEVPVAYR